MRILLVAYEFIPSPSPQSLRWAYLARGLADRGHEVHVLAPDLPTYQQGLPVLPASIQVHRTWAGPFMGWLSARQKRRGHVSLQALDGSAQTTSVTGLEILNWKGRLWNSGMNWKGRAFEVARRLAGAIQFPDIRAEWTYPAQRALDALVHRIRPDVVIVSHEPASTLPLGLRMGRLGIPWVADLGDPVLAVYTPFRWRRRAAHIERAVSFKASMTIVTSDATRQLLAERHGLTREKVLVLTQGHPGHATGPLQRGAAPDSAGGLRLLYTGSFYSFRDANPLLLALSATDGACLLVASSRVPEYLREFARRHPQKVRLLGFVKHSLALQLQAEADVLVNIANADPVQVPGKFYEYLGAGRPILHIGNDSNGAAPKLLRQLRRGWITSTDADSITITLQRLVEAKRQSTLDAGLDLSPSTVREYSWHELSGRLADALRDVCALHTSSHLTP